jgi:hypothetical protein
MTPEPPAQAAPLMQETRAASLFRRQSQHECTLSHRSPRSRRSCGLNQQAAIRAWTRLALHRDAGCCVARDSGVDRHTRMAGGQGFQPLVTLPASYCRPPSSHVGPQLGRINAQSVLASQCWPSWAWALRPHGSPHRAPSRWRVAHRLRQVLDSPVSPPAGRSPGSETSWRDFETAPIVAFLPARLASL